MFSFSICLVALAKTLSSILNRFSESGQPCVFHDFSGMALSLSPFKLLLALSLCKLPLSC